MERYDYLENIKNDLRSWIEDNFDNIPKGDTTTAWEYIQDETFISDSVTGNASGSYTFNAWEAEENLCHNFDLLSEALSEFGSDAGAYIERGAETCDVIIRCYLLSEALSAVMDEYDFEDDEEEEEEDSDE